MKSFRMLMLLLALMPAAVFAPSALARAPADKWTPTDPAISRAAFAIASDGVVIRNAVMEGAQPEHYTLEELQAALEIWIDAIERARRRHE